MTDTTDEIKVLRVSAHAHRQLKELADEERRTITAQVEIAIEQMVAAARARKARAADTTMIAA